MDSVKYTYDKYVSKSQGTAVHYDFFSARVSVCVAASQGSYWFEIAEIAVTLICCSINTETKPAPAKKNQNLCSCHRKHDF